MSAPTAGPEVYRFAAPVILSAGQSYNLVLTSPAGTAYSVFAIRKGVEYGFAPTTYFADGRGQVTTGSGWGPFTQDGGGPLEPRAEDDSKSFSWRAPFPSAEC